MLLAERDNLVFDQLPFIIFSLAFSHFGDSDGLGEIGRTISSVDEL